MKKVLVVGDIIIDEYTYGTRLGISAETPTVVAKYHKTETFVGGAALVARNLVRLGCEVTLPSAKGDMWSPLLANLEKDERSRLHGYVFDLEGWTTTQKRRYFVDDYKMVQYDILNEGRWGGPHANKSNFILTIDELLKKHDCLVLRDNRHGLLDQHVGGCLVEIAKNQNKPVYVDSQVSQKGTNLRQYSGCDYAFVNERELDAYLLDAVGTLENDRKWKLSQAQRLLAGTVVLKLGAEGSMTLEQGIVPAPVVNAVDTCGAGDAYLAAFVSSDGDMEFANKWAARSTTHKGTIVPLREETK